MPGRLRLDDEVVEVEVEVEVEVVAAEVVVVTAVEELHLRRWLLPLPPTPTARRLPSSAAARCISRVSGRRVERARKSEGRKRDESWGEMEI